MRSYNVLISCTACANVCNVMLMRNHELSEGIEIKNQDGEIVGTSLIAARKVPVNKR